MQTESGVRVREVFPENIRAIRWHGSSQLGTFSVEPEAPALCAFLYGKDWQPTYKYFVDVRRPSRASNLEEFGARLAALRQGVASRAPLQQIANLPVSLAKEEGTFDTPVVSRQLVESMWRHGLRTSG